MASLALVPSPAHKSSLFELEESLVALLDTADLVSPEDEAIFEQDLSTALSQAVDKRQNFHEFLCHLESQAETASKEIERLRAWKAHVVAVQERLESYCVSVIERIGPDLKGKLKRLEGRTVTLSARGMVPQVEITDESQLPASCRRVEVKLPADLWAELLDSVDFDVRGKLIAAAGENPKTEASRSTIKTLLEEKIGPAIEEHKKAGALSVQHADVPGARLNLNRHYLVRK